MIVDDDNFDGLIFIHTGDANRLGGFRQGKAMGDQFFAVDALAAQEIERERCPQRRCREGTSQLQFLK